MSNAFSTASSAKTLAGKELSQVRKDAIDARWGEVLTSYPAKLRDDVNKYRVALRKATLDTDALDELVAIHGGVLNHGL